MVIGVYRIHATHQEETRDEEDETKEPEEDWDSSALSITVNPMEVCGDTRKEQFPNRFQDKKDNLVVVS